MAVFTKSFTLKPNHDFAGYGEYYFEVVREITKHSIGASVWVSPRLNNFPGEILLTSRDRLRLEDLSHVINAEVRPHPFGFNGEIVTRRSELENDDSNKDCPGIRAVMSRLTEGRDYRIVPTDSVIRGERQLRPMFNRASHTSLIRWALKWVRDGKAVEEFDYILQTSQPVRSTEPSKSEIIKFGDTRVGWWLPRSALRL